MGDRHKRDALAQACFEIETARRLAEPSLDSQWESAGNQMNIAAMTMGELAELVVTLDGWKWMKGIVDADGDVVLGRGRMAHLYLDGGGGYLSAGERYSAPNLTDPATLGCLLAMVRRKHGEYTYTLPTGRGWRVLIGNPDERFVSVVSAKEEMPTEAHALVAALAREGRS